MDLDLFATDVVSMFNRNKELLAEEYGHITIPDVSEVTPWLNGEATKPVDKNTMDVTRGHQFKQLTSAIGAYRVDRKTADPETVSTYKKLWTIKIKKLCPYCSADTRSLLMFQNNTCGKARCQLRHMHENI